MIAFSNGKIFNGQELLDARAVLVTADTIVDIIPSTELPPGVEFVDLKGGYLAPAFIDLQIYGGNGLLFAEYPSVSSLHATYQYSLEGGASYILPTIATNTYEKIFEAIDAVAAYQEAGLPGVAGLHVEGPYINPAKKGAHVEALIIRPELDEVKRLMEKGKGIIKMITLAPEVCTGQIIEYLQQQEVIVSAGHTNATYEQAMQAFSKGIQAATHLYNAMSPLQHRAPGMVGAVFNAANVRSSIVADGHHVDFAAVRIAKKVLNERLFYITDAVTENKTGIYPHHLQDDKYVVADGTLSGSALTMLKAVKNGINHAGISMIESFRMASLYPWQVLRKENEYGRIARNYKAELVLLNDVLDLKAIYTSGKLNRF